MTIIQQSTKDYKRFVMNQMNRTISDGEAGFVPRKDLLESMKRDGFWKVAPVICTEVEGGKLNIVEGHNRFVTARYLGLPIEFIAYPDEVKVSPLQYSKHQKTWSQSDIAKGYSQEGNADYAEVMEFHAKTGIPLSCAFSMFHGEVSSSGNASPKVKAGTFKIKDREKPWVVAAITGRIGEYVKFSVSQNLVHAISKAVFAEGFDTGRMMERIAKNPELLRKCRTLDEYIEMLDGIYNRNMKTARYYLKAEIDKAMRARSAAPAKAE